MSPAGIFTGPILVQPADTAGPPTSGDWERGTLYIDSEGALYQCIASGTPGTWLAVGSSIPPPDLVASFPEFIDTFVNGVQTGMGWATSINGGSAALSQIAPPAGKGGRNTVVGVIGIATGTSTTGRAGAILGANMLRFEAGGRYRLWARFLAEQLASTTENYRFRIGFIDDNTATEPSDGVYFEYQRATSPNWLCKTARASTRTISTTSVVVQNANWIDLLIDVDGSAQTATFYIDDVQVAQINTNIPQAAGRETSVGFVIHKTAGGTTRRVALDRVYLKLSAA